MCNILFLFINMGVIASGFALPPCAWVTITIYIYIYIYIYICVIYIINEIHSPNIPMRAGRFI